MDIKLGELEATILYAIHRCGNNAYGVTIADDIKDQTNGKLAVPPGAIYATLDRLENKGLLRSQWSEPTSERGGRRKRLFEMTGAGTKVLADYDRRLMSIRAGWSAALEVTR